MSLLGGRLGVSTDRGSSSSRRHEPMTQKPSFEEWEGILTGAAYRFVYGDGLNWFYVVGGA